ncbi:hypothetical protein CAL29_26375 [Bordetella genomosp. 10]|uniref:AsmA domain-containing protein n=1 Tax=Bordetella genomosp. 10 TaxID=1416804 RepID=A0A261S4N1_9BORD|nr:DUF748 domain-containing protein [Bordetella genomosp. 10]OZI31433.1 hypothetical protein CAL29_26375 [Bordetella genomosp. 10]
MSLRIPRIRFSRRLGRIGLGIVGFILLVFALAAWQVPNFTRKALTGQVAEMLGREVQVGKITFNPFTLTLRVHDLQVAQPGSPTPLLAVGEANASVAWRSLVWFAPVVDRLELREPKVALVREGPARFNFSDIQQKLADMAAAQPPVPEEEKDKPLPRFSLNNMLLKGGSITLDDKVTGRKQVIDEIALGVPFISNFGYATDIDVLPRFHARINGSPFDMRGTARPFDKVPASTLDVVFTGLALDQWADAWPAPMPIKLQHGLLDSDLHIAFEQPHDAPVKLRVTGSLGVRDFDLRESAGDELAAWRSLNVRQVDVDVIGRTAAIGEVELLDPRIQTRRDANQRINWLDIIDKLQRLGAGDKTTGAPAVSTVKTMAPPSAATGQGGDAKDAAAAQSAPAQPAPAVTAQPAAAQPAGAPAAASTATAPPPAGKPAAAAAATPAAPSGNGATPAPATPTPAPAPAPAPRHDASTPWQVTVGAINIGNGNVHLRDAATKLDYALQKLDVTVQQVRFPQPKDQPIGLWLTMDNADGAKLRGVGKLIMQPLALDLDVRAASLPLAPFAQAVRNAAPVLLQSGTVGVSAQVNVADRNNVLAVEASDIKVDAADIAARDESVNPAVDVGLKHLALAVDKWTLGSGSSNFDLKADGLLGQGALATQGSFALQPLQVSAKVDLSKLDLARFAPYAASSLNATVRSISVGAKGEAKFTAAAGGKPMQASWTGAVNVDDLNLLDRVNRAEFLAWKTLAFSNMAIQVVGDKPRLDLGDIVLDDFYGNVLLNGEGRLNVMDLVAEPGKAGGSITQDTQTRAAPRPAPAGKSGGGMPDITVRSVTLKNGRATFNDRFVKPNYTAELSSVSGSVSALSSTNPQPAKVSVNGRVYRTAPLSISGVVNPFAKFLTLDLKATARGVDLPRFTTYSSKYVGYPIKRGKLSVDLEYRIKDRALSASNHVLLNQLTFGEKTNSKDATTLPVMLAVALLKDRNGNIDIDLPVSGSLDDPSFSVGRIILGVLGNLVVKAVTSPFSLLASAFGGGEELSYVTFAPGSDKLDDTARDRLGKLATALADRPSLQMDIAGRADPVTDEQGLRQAWVDQRIRAAQARATGKSTRLSDTPLSAADRAKYLESVYDNTKMDNKPRNFIGMAKSLPPDQMEDLLRKAAPVGDEQLRRLADARAQAVYEALQAQGAPADRIFVVAPELSAEGIKDKDAPSRVEFSLKH